MLSMVNQMGWLSTVVIEKSMEQRTSYQDLESNLGGLNQRLMLVTTQNQNLEQEL
jgi:hypothetical protein